jgi:L-2-hydroxyglutarate oxidase LhgO
VRTTGIAAPPARIVTGMADHVIVAGAGIFLTVRAHRQVHVLNAPSPAATAALEIGRRIAAGLDEQHV